MPFSFHSLYCFSSSSLNSLLFNLFWSEKIINSEEHRAGTWCSRASHMWAIGKWYKVEKSCDLHRATSWPLFTAINLISKETAFCLIVHCFIFFFLYYRHACLCFTNSSYFLQFNNGLTKQGSVLSVQADKQILLSTQLVQSR